MLTKHSNSLKQQSFQLTQISFFDTSYSSEKFWKQMDLKDDDFSSHPLILENNFKVPSKSLFQAWEACTLTIRGNFLLLKKVEVFRGVSRVLSFNRKNTRTMWITLIWTSLCTESKWTGQNQSFTPRNTHVPLIYTRMGGVLICIAKNQYN